MYPLQNSEAGFINAEVNAPSMSLADLQDHVIPLGVGHLLLSSRQLRKG